jgi:hypothetical protein
MGSSEKLKPEAPLAIRVSGFVPDRCRLNSPRQEACRTVPPLQTDVAGMRRRWSPVVVSQNRTVP